jgi:hypothetical protein
MAHRTTLLLDDATRAAARDLAGRYGCSVSEAIRRSVLRQREVALGVPEERRAERKKALRRAYKLFAANDADAEIRRLKAEDTGF